MQKESLAGKIWGMFSPILVYEIMITIMPLILAGCFPILWEEANAMWLLTLVNFGTLPILVWLYGRDRFWREAWAERRKAVGVLEIVLVIVGAAAFSRGFNLLIGVTPLPIWFPEYEEISEVIYGGSLASQLAASVISAPILEELLMRGLFYNRTCRLLKNVKTAILLNAFTFGLFHGNVVQGVYAFLMGLFFVGVYERYRSLPLAILAHMAANATSIVLEILPGPNEMLDYVAGYSLQMALCLLLSAVCWRSLEKREDKSQRNI